MRETQEVVERDAPPRATPDEDGGAALEKAHLLAQLQLLTRVLGAGTGTLDLEHLLVAAITELERHLPLCPIAVWVCEGPELSATTLLLAERSTGCEAWLDELGLVRGTRVGIPNSPFAHCLRDGTAQYADWRQPRSAKGATACLAVPLRCGARPAGVLQSISRRAGGFTREQIQLLHLVADLLGPAISNCQMFGQMSTAYEELRATQTQLVQTEKMRALGELAGGVAHDFNNALSCVLGFLELSLAEKDLPGPCRGWLESARTSALDAAHTVKRVQDFARPRGRELTDVTLDLNELTRQTAELTRHKWGRPTASRARPIHLRMELNSRRRVRGNPSELREMLTNLIFNAADAMPDGGTLGLRTWSTTTEIILAVSDTGVGIPDAVRKRLFEPFFSTKGERGTGLGLSVSFGIVQRHGGKIEVESVVDQGSTFLVRLPTMEDSSIGAHPILEACGLTLERRSLRILIVEDEDLVRSFLETGLRQLGHRPTAAGDAPAALAAFGEEPYDLVITDLGLPGLSGEAVARAVSRQSPQTPVVLLTGWADQIQAEGRPRLEGVTRVLGKPVTLVQLARTCDEVCAG